MQPRLSERFLPFKAANMIIWASTAALYCSCWETGWRKTWETWGLWFEFSQFISAISDILSVQPSTAPVRLLNRRKLAVLEDCRLQGLNIQYVIKCTRGSVSLHCKNYKGKRIFVLWMPTVRCGCRSTWRKKTKLEEFLIAGLQSEHDNMAFIFIIISIISSCLITERILLAASYLNLCFKGRTRSLP